MQSDVPTPLWVPGKWHGTCVGGFSVGTTTQATAGKGHLQAMGGGDARTISNGRRG